MSSLYLVDIVGRVGSGEHVALFCQYEGLATDLVIVCVTRGRAVAGAQLLAQCGSVQHDCSARGDELVQLE